MSDTDTNAAREIAHKIIQDVIEDWGNNELFIDDGHGPGSDLRDAFAAALSRHRSTRVAELERELGDRERAKRDNIAALELLMEGKNDSRSVAEHTKERLARVAELENLNRETLGMLNMNRRHNDLLARRIAELEGALTFAKLRSFNLQRVPLFGHGLNAWNALEWAGAMCGEAGEAANAAKKIRRLADGCTVNTTDVESLRRSLANEIADVLIYADLLAASEGIDLAEAVARKFDEVSDRVGFIARLALSAPAEGEKPKECKCANSDECWCGNWPKGPKSPAPSTAEQVKELRSIAERLEGELAAAKCEAGVTHDEIERLTDWAIEHGYDMRPGRLAGGLTLLGLATKLHEKLSTVTRERDAAVKVIERLPKTADGVPITPGMSVHIHEHVNGNPTTAQVWVNAIRFNAESVETSWGKTLPSRCYSTREAALASLKENR